MKDDAVEEPQHLAGASGGVWKVGGTVRRPTGYWTPAVHELLAWLAEEGLGGLPHVSGVDESDREIVSYIEGRSVLADKEIVLDQVLVEAVTWLRSFHDFVSDFEPSESSLWRPTGPEAAVLQPGQIICHNDPGVYNWIVQAGHFVAMIDWDMAGPGEPLDDLAFMAWTAIPLYRDIGPEETARRLELMAETYGECGPLRLMELVVQRMNTAVGRIEAGIKRKDPGLLTLATQGEPERTRQRIADFESRLGDISRALD